MPDRPPTADSRDKTSVDVISLDRIHALKRVPDQDWRTVAWGGILWIRLIFQSWLEITGPALAAWRPRCFARFDPAHPVDRSQNM
jgi:hypothetical protein